MRVRRSSLAARACCGQAGWCDLETAGRHVLAHNRWSSTDNQPPHHSALLRSNPSAIDAASTQESVTPICRLDAAATTPDSPIGWRLTYAHFSVSPHPTSWPGAWTIFCFLH